MALYFLHSQLACVVIVLSLVGHATSLTGGSSEQRHWLNERGIGNFNHEITKNVSSYIAFRSLLQQGATRCNMDRSKPPDLESLVACQNSSMFHVWRPKARLIAPRGWMNDPTAIFETKNGSFHVGYQCSPDHLGWANISQCAASTEDFVHFKDYRSWKDPVTLAPSQIYDIRGVFDGVVIKDGWNGHPSLIYTSTYVGQFGPRSNPPEVEGTETQSVAYTEDDGQTWTKLNFGQKGNPIIYYWPETNLSGFRDPYVFESREFSNFYADTSIQHQTPGKSNGETPSGDKYLILSGGIRTEADPVNGGPRLFFYRQNENNNIRDWVYLGPLLSFTAEHNQTSKWRGGNGINFEKSSFSVIKERGLVEDPSFSNTAQLNIFTIGSDGARSHSHNNLWPIWHAVSWDYSSPDGNVKGKVDFSGIIDWGRAYAFTQFAKGERQMTVGWTYEDDDFDVLTEQRGASGAFTLFRDMFVKIIRNIHPSALTPPEHGPSWTIKEEKDGSHSLITLGQSILPEIKAAFQKHSDVTKLSDRTINSEALSMKEEDKGVISTMLVPFETQPKDRYYVISAQLEFFNNQNRPDDELIHRPKALRGGFRILSSEYEWTDVYYDPNQEYLVVDRSNSSSIPSYGSSKEMAKHRLWPILNPETNRTNWESLNLTIVVDNSVLEVHANDCTIITTRVYPWYNDSIGVKYFVQSSEIDSGKGKLEKGSTLEESSKNSNLDAELATHSQSVRFAQVELWDGLLNAWPTRPHDTYIPGVYSHNITGYVYGVWADL